MKPPNRRARKRDAADSAPEEDEASARSSGPDSADSGEEADFLEGIDPCHDMYVTVKCV